MIYSMHNFIYRGSPLGALQHAEAEINGNDHRILQVVWEALSGSYTYFTGLVSNNPIRQTSPSEGEAEPFYGFLQEIIEKG